MLNSDQIDEKTKVHHFGMPMILLLLYAMGQRNNKDIFDLRLDDLRFTITLKIYDL